MASFRYIEKPLFPPVLQAERGEKRLSYSSDFHDEHLTGVHKHFCFFHRFPASAKNPRTQLNQLVQLSEVLDGANHLRGVAVLVVARRKRRAGLRQRLRHFHLAEVRHISASFFRNSANSNLPTTTTPSFFVGLLIASKSLSYQSIYFNISKNYVNEFLAISFPRANEC